MTIFTLCIITAIIKEFFFANPFDLQREHFISKLIVMTVSSIRLRTFEKRN